MPRVLLLIPLVVLALAGCGSGSSASPSPVNAELSYFPSSSPFVMSITTDPDSVAVRNAQSLIDRFPITTFGQSALMARLSQLGIDYQGQIRPLFGNPIMVGVTGPRPTRAPGSIPYLVVWVTKDAAKLSALIKRIPGVRAVGSHDGASLYSSSGSATLAVDGATAIVGASAAEVVAALDRHTHNGGITRGQYARAFAGLPQNGLIQTFGNLSGSSSRPDAAYARRVPWVAALRWYAANVTASSSGLSFRYRLATSGRALNASQLPLATASAPPPLARTLPISVGIQNPAHIFSFAEAAEQQASPAAYARFRKRQAAMRARTGVDLNSLLKLADGPLIVASDAHTTLARAAVSDPAAAARTLAKLMSDPGTVFEKAANATRLPGGFYAIRQRRQTLTVGVSAGQLVAGRATAAQLRAFATEPVSKAPGTQGAVAFRVAVGDLVRLGLRHSAPKLAQPVLSALGDITGWINSGPSATTGSATLAVR